ncbi:MAG: HAD family phosphatase [Candidatus Omnitrophica bacterium]|nr:HAD family phosphatase [Candidatus Omnitrophota bacterium]
MKRKIKGIIFDLGNVLIDFDHNIAAKRICACSEKTIPEVYQFFFDSPLTGMFEEGKISEQDFFSEVKKALGLNIGYEQFLPIWNEIFFLSENNRRVYSLAKSLREKYRIIILSNINVLHYSFLKNNFSVFDAFNDVVTSFEQGSRKPDELIYKTALYKLDAHPEEVFYTDDRQDLIAAAQKLGIHSFVFQGPEKLEKDLEIALS